MHMKLLDAAFIPEYVYVTQMFLPVILVGGLVVLTGWLLWRIKKRKK